VNLCLAKDPAKRPTAKALLEKSWFKKANEAALVNFMEDLPEPKYKGFAEPTELDQSKPTAEPDVKMSWVFSKEDLTKVKEGVRHLCLL